MPAVWALEPADQVGLVQGSKLDAETIIQLYDTIRYDTMLCYAMLCYAILCYAMLCYAMLCYAMLCYAMLCYAMLYYILYTIYYILYTIYYISGGPRVTPFGVTPNLMACLHHNSYIL